MKKWIFLTVLLALFTHQTLYSQGCEITVEHNAGNAFVMDIKSNKESYSPGGWVSYSQAHITKIENTGRNDLMVRTRHSNGNTDEYHTINNGNQTIWFPLPNFSGTSLHQVRCLSYSTIHDTNDLISDFGGSAQNLINEAQSAAQQGAENVRDNIIALVNEANYQNFQQQVGQAQQEMAQQWEELQQTAAENADIGELVLSEHFPELHEAIQATTSLNVNIPEAVLQTHEQNLENIQIKLQEMDQKYEVSSNISTFANIDLRDYFPELFAIEEYQCTINTDLLDQFENEFNRFLTDFGQLMEVLISEADLPVFGFTARETDQLRRLQIYPPCLDEMEKANQTIVEDLNRFLDFVTAIRDNLNGWDVRWFARGNEAVYEDSRKLLESSERLIRLLVRQRQLEHNTTQAKEEMDESYEQLQYGYGRSENLNAVDMTEHIIDVVINPRDSEKIQQDLDNHQTAVERYERALNARELGWQNLQREAVTWTDSAASLANALTRLRLDVRVITDFNRLMDRPLTLEFPAESLRLAQSCITTTNKNFTTILNIFSNAFERYLADWRDKMQFAVPDEFYLALRLHYEIFAEIHANLNAQAEFAASAVTLSGSYLQLAEAYHDLGILLIQDPTNPHFITLIENRLETVSDRAQDVSSDSNSFNQAWANASPNIDAILNATIEFKTTLESRLTLRPEFRELFNTLLTIESIQNGLVDMSESVNTCVSGKLDLVKEATDTFPQRSQAFIDLISGMALDTVPDEIKESIANLVMLTDMQISNYADLRSWEVVEEELANGQSFVMATAFAPLDFVQFHNDFIFALIPIPQPDAMPKLESLVQSFDDMVIETQELRAVIENIIETDQMAAQELQTLAMYARTQHEEMSKDMAELQWIVFDGSPIASEIEKMQDVAALWIVAGIETAERITGLGNGVSELALRLADLRPQVEQAMQNLGSQTAAAISCASEAIQARSGIANQSINTAVTQATADISLEANSVFYDLQNLLNPTSNLLSSVQQVIDAGQNLIQEVQQSASAGQSTFENLVAGSYQQMQNAISCVDTRSDIIQQRIDELTGYYNEIQGTNQFIMMEIINNFE